MKQIYEGKTVVVGNNIDTDQIYPGPYLELTDPKQIGSHCLAGVDESIAPNFPENGMVIAGTNFGCGSSREHAPISLISMGAALVLADSFARIFFRNAINLGLPLIVCKGISSHVKSGQTLRVDVMTGKVVIVETGETLDCEPFSDQTVKILEAGGIKPQMRAMDN